MYVRTEDNEILNLNHFMKVIILDNDLIAFNSNQNAVVICSFDNLESAEQALDVIVNYIWNSKTIWDAKVYKYNLLNPSTAADFAIGGVANRNTES